MNEITVTNQSSAGDILSSSSAPQDLDKQAFLRLLVTQMRFQDPLDPMDNENFIAQLAQFSSLENLNNIYEEISMANLLQQSAHNALSTSLIGKYSLTAGDSVEVRGESVGNAVYVMPEEGDVEIRVLDENGAVVRTFFETELAAGEHLVAWDGKGESGERVPDGEYTIEVEYATGARAGENISVLKVGRIHAVRFISGSPVLLIDGVEHRLADIVEVMESLPEG